MLRSIVVVLRNTASVPRGLVAVLHSPALVSRGPVSVLRSPVMVLCSTKAVLRKFVLVPRGLMFVLRKLKAALRKVATIPRRLFRVFLFLTLARDSGKRRGGWLVNQKGKKPWRVMMSPVSCLTQVFITTSPWRGKGEELWPRYYVR